MERRFEPQNAKMQEFPDNLAGLPGNSDCCADSAALAEQPCFSTPRKAHHFLGGTFAMILSSEVSFLAFQIMCMCARACFLMLVLTGCKYGMLPTECMFVPRMGDAGSTLPFCVWMKLCFPYPSLHVFIRPLILFHSAISPSPSHRTPPDPFNSILQIFSPCFSLHRFLHNMFVKNWMHPCRVHINLNQFTTYVCICMCISI